MSAARFGKVALLMGGTSAEREISLKSGAAVQAALEKLGVDVTAIDAADNLIAQLQAGQFDRVFNMLHGRMGEDGVVQGLLELMGLPYTGSGVQASAIAMDKLKTKQIWQSMGLPTPAYYVISDESQLDDVVAQVGLPLIIKPAHEGSSIGMSKVSKAENLKQAWENARQYDAVVMAEQWITGHEYTAAVLQRESLPLIRLEPTNDFYDFHAKYVSDTTVYHCPCGLDAAEEKSIQQLALAAFDAIGAVGWGRVDVMRDEAGKSWLIELNTLPGMTDHSLVPMAAAQAGMTFEQLVERILEASMTGEQQA